MRLVHRTTTPPAREAIGLSNPLHTPGGSWAAARLRDADETVRHKVIRLPDAEAARRGLLGDGEPAPAG